MWWIIGMIIGGTCLVVSGMIISYTRYENEGFTGIVFSLVLLMASGIAGAEDNRVKTNQAAYNQILAEGWEVESILVKNVDPTDPKQDPTRNTCLVRTNIDGKIIYGVLARHTNQGYSVRVLRDGKVLEALNVPKN